MSYEMNVLEFEYKNVKDKIRDKRREMSKSFRQEHKRIFRFLDYGMALAIFLNIMALIMTNALAVKKEPTKLLMEVNPVQALNGGFAEHPESKSLFGLFLLEMMFWALIIGGYAYTRFHTYEYKGYYVLIAIVLWYLSSTGYDFFNDFGYLIGKMIYGG